MAFGGPRSSCIRPGAHSARCQNSHKDWTPCRMAGPFVSAGAHAPHADETHDLRLRGGRRTPLVAYAPSLSCAPPRSPEGAEQPVDRVRPSPAAFPESRVEVSRIMSIQLHPNARTTPAIRLELQVQPQSISNRELAETYNLSRHTVAKWRWREGTADASHRPPIDSMPPLVRPRKRWWWPCVKPSCYPWMTCWP